MCVVLALSGLIFLLAPAILVVGLIWPKCLRGSRWRALGAAFLLFALGVVISEYVVTPEEHERVRVQTAEREVVRQQESARREAEQAEARERQKVEREQREAEAEQRAQAARARREAEEQERRAAEDERQRTEDFAREQAAREERARLRWQSERARADLPTLIRMPRPTTGTASAVYAEAEQYLLNCPLDDPEAEYWCQLGQEQFLRDYLRSRAGQYQGQRNVAFTLAGFTDNPQMRGYSRGVIVNRIQSCAWRMVILTAGHAEADQGDDANARMVCSRLSDTERTAATARAQALHRLIAIDPVRNPPPRGMPTTQRR